MLSLAPSTHTPFIASPTGLERQPSTPPDAMSPPPPPCAPLRRPQPAHEDVYVRCSCEGFTCQSLFSVHIWKYSLFSLSLSLSRPLSITHTHTHTHTHAHTHLVRRAHEPRKVERLVVQVPLEATGGDGLHPPSNGEKSARRVAPLHLRVQYLRRVRTVSCVVFS